MVVELADDIESSLSRLQFKHALRGYQREILELVNVRLEQGCKTVHIVAPPGAGKTIIGLQLVSRLKLPAVIFCPNTTIQSQWRQKLDLFLPQGEQSGELLGLHEDAPLKPITVLTYQVLSTPDREREYLDKLAHQSWVEELTRGPKLSVGEAELRILELRQNNPRAYDREMSRHVSRLRRRLADVLELEEVLHGNALDLIQTLRRQKFKLVIFDECHHLTDYWAAVMSCLVGRLDNPIIVGLTGTPPEGKSAGQENRYLSLVGDIDYQVPTPALVKERGLAPFQDLVFFTHPTDKELEFLEKQHHDLHGLLEEISQSGNDHNQPLTQWVLSRLALTEVHGWDSFVEQNGDLAQSLGRYCWSKKVSLLHGASLTQEMRRPLTLDDWMALLEDLALNSLKTSDKPDDHKLYERIKLAARKIGYALTEAGMRRQATPVDRVLAYSVSKAVAAAQILEVESANLQEKLRAIVVTDFERMSATEARSAGGVLSEESGGALGAMQVLVDHAVAGTVHPCLVTGSLLLVDERIAPSFVEAGNAYLAAQDKDQGQDQDQALTLKTEPVGAELVQISAVGRQWDTRLYVGMATAIFEQGITKCLVGTRGIFGEGWDSQVLNTLIDLTTTTSPVSVKQLRGRSIRLDNNNPLGAAKVANNWDVVCVVPELEKGMSDYQRFIRRQDGYFGIADDGQIECGAGHVHASFCELAPDDILKGIAKINSSMIERAANRDRAYRLWNVSGTYLNRTLGCVEVSGFRNTGLTPPYIHKDMDYREHIAMMKSALRGIWLEYLGLGFLLSSIFAYLLWMKHWPLLVALAPSVVLLYIGNERHSALYKNLREQTCKPVGRQVSLQQMGVAVLTTLQQLKEISRNVGRESVKSTLREDSSVRVIIDGAEHREAQCFIECIKELLSEVKSQSHYISKHEFVFSAQNASLEEEEKFFSEYLAGKAQLEIAALHPLPRIIARSEKARQCFAAAWNKYIGPGCVEDAGIAPVGLSFSSRYADEPPVLSTRLLWE